MLIRYVMYGLCRRQPPKKTPSSLVQRRPQITPECALPRISRLSKAPFQACPPLTIFSIRTASTSPILFKFRQNTKHSILGRVTKFQNAKPNGLGMVSEKHWRGRAKLIAI